MPSVRSTIKTYYVLTKPGIVYGNAITAIGGFFLASKGQFNAGLFLAMLGGISLVIASACTCNNYMDQDIDQLMARTKKRALVQKQVSGRNALIFAALLLLIGCALLGFFTNLLTLIIGVFGFFAYVVVYGISKRRSVHGTLIGSISGAVPVVVGYCAVANQLDLGALLLFFILVIWQMPHFYAVAMYRIHDYTAASIPVLPIKKGMEITKVHILLYIGALIPVDALLTLYGYTGYVYLVGMTLLSVIWLVQGFRTFHIKADGPWGRWMFFFSLLFIVVFSGLLLLNFVLP